MKTIDNMWEDQEKEFWTLEELAGVLNQSPKSFAAHFRREQNKLKAKGIIVTKYGRGENARYTLDYGYEED